MKTNKFADRHITLKDVGSTSINADEIYLHCCVPARLFALDRFGTNRLYESLDSNILSLDIRIVRILKLGKEGPIILRVVWLCKRAGSL